MEITSLTFNIKDVITIVVGIGSFLGFYYALKREVEKVSIKVDSLEEKQEKDHQSVTEAMKEHKDESNKKEDQVYKRINEIRDEVKDAHGKLEVKIDGIVGSISTMNTNLSELTGYIKAKKES
jgi:predicted Holliday junction resolvase-like endonuclease